MTDIIGFNIVESVSRRLDNDDNSTEKDDSNSLKNTLVVNLVIFAVLMTCFEASRHIHLLYLKRVNKKYVKQNRVPPIPPRYPFGWIVEISKISEENLLQMIGLDAYMLLRYINICIRFSAFVMFFGCIVLAPIYYYSPNNQIQWSKYTIANIPNDPNETGLWAPAIFAYVFSAYFCYLMYAEYKHFVDKRVQYLLHGDPETPIQTYYTVMVEELPPALRSEPELRKFFERIFPDGVHSVEIALEINELEKLCTYRKTIRNNLEKAVAAWKATGNRPRIWVRSDFYQNTSEAPIPVKRGKLAEIFGYEIFDSIEHYSKLLDMLNAKVRQLQEAYLQTKYLNDEERAKIQGLFEKHTTAVVDAIRGKIANPMIEKVTKFTTDVLGSTHDPKENLLSPNQQSELNTDPERDDRSSSPLSEGGRSSGTNNGSNNNAVLDLGVKLVNAAGTGVNELAKEGLKTAKIATKGALLGVLEATRTLELLTVGSSYEISSTAFVTLSSRLWKSCAHQMILSQKFAKLEVRSAPNPKDIIWENVSIPAKQNKLRHQIAGYTIALGALCWSFVVGFITTIGNMDSLSQEFTWLQAYSSTYFYQILNSYLAAALLLLLLNILPGIFDFIARNYEGMKVESEIQYSIMARYFYYQLANVFVSVGLGSLISSIHQIVNRPQSILSILGNSLPEVSIYLTNLVIVKTFTAIPLEHIRILPLLEIASVMLCLDKKKCTRRELRTGAFADPPMLYGWIYPNIMMILMIMMTYSCIAPFTVPFCLVFFVFAYLMYKYQLLYVYVNDYQSGGYMWYAVFTRSMLCLLGGVITLICYLGIRQTYMTGPFYLLLPLPILIYNFWKGCEARFKNTSLDLSLESSVDLDRVTQEKIKHGQPAPQTSFAQSMFRQPSLVAEDLKPAPYRRRVSEPKSYNIFAYSQRTPSESFMSTNSSDEGNSPLAGSNELNLEYEKDVMDEVDRILQSDAPEEEKSITLINEVRNIDEAFA